MICDRALVAIVRPFALELGPSSARAERSDRAGQEIGNLPADPDDVRDETRVRESGGLDRPFPLLGGEEPTIGSVDRVQSRRSECLDQIEDELSIDGLARVRPYALGCDQPSTGTERAQDLAQRE